jgi:hypothetical protein
MIHTCHAVAKLWRTETVEHIVSAAIICRDQGGTEAIVMTGNAPHSAPWSD